ncbi:hypothetical protein [Streptomyces sp. NPDC059009]|uniref:hypothetical protein n=1 Tax=Streptomyces sp. NPDC059009 TaxID=3346694 RepID=UPI0036D175E2
MAEEGEAGRQRAPEPEVGVTEPSTTPSVANAEQPAADSTAPHTEPPVDNTDTTPPSGNPPLLEQPSWREPDARTPPARRNRKRTTENRDQDKKIRFTPTAVRIIDEAAKRRRLTFAGFVGDAALAVALDKANMVGSPEDDPIRPLVEAVEAHTKALNRIGTNLNQIMGAIHSSAIPERTEAVLGLIEQAAKASYDLMDQLIEESAAHGA